MPSVTVSGAFAVRPVPWSEVTLLVSFIFVPGVIAVMFNEKLQPAPGSNVAFDKAMRLDPGTAEIIPPKLLQSPCNPLGVATIKPDGRLSPNATFVSGAAELGLATAKLRDTVPPTWTDGALNALKISGGCTAAGARAPSEPIKDTNRHSTAKKRVVLLKIMTLGWLIEPPEQ
ncbi:MAG TPA: hypothetical protein VN982_03825 [Candidatus Dormibacteraeota bacterium]|nr:hypothetical protein [Candidatus Dormibacteraeota bacterium]